MRPKSYIDPDPSEGADAVEALSDWELPAPSPGTAAAQGAAVTAIEIVSRGSRALLTDAIEKEICDAVEAGAYLHVAAEAAGLTANTVARWLADERPRFREFQREISSAQARARMSAEKRMLINDPKTWLTRGPGRERGEAGRPGWASPSLRVEGQINHAHAHMHIATAIDVSKLGDERLDQLIELIGEVLPAAESAGGEVSAGEGVIEGKFSEGEGD